MTFAAFSQRYLPPLEAEMRVVVASDDDRLAALFGMLHYHLGWADQDFHPVTTSAGKRIRPTLCLLVCEACGGCWEQALPAAAAIELLHNFSLIHDDIEDGDAQRRGRATLWTIWGEAQAINTGDALFSLSELAILRLVERNVPAAIVVRAITTFNRTCVALTGGQHLDIGFEGRDDVTVADYLAMVRGKTAALLTCTCQLGALIAGAEPAQHEAMAQFGLNLGLAFQVRDDILGIWGDPGVTGKPAGADIVRRKKSLPIVHGVSASAEFRELIHRGTLQTADVAQAAHLLEKAGSRAFAESLNAEFHAHALEGLQRADLSGAAAEAIAALVETLLTRDH